MSRQKLYIIGNGFDLHHGIASSYYNFRQFICDRYPHIYDSVKKYLLDINDSWSNFEMALASIDVDEIEDVAGALLQDYGSDDWSDSGHYAYQEKIREIVSFQPELYNCFSEWISGVDISKAKKRLCLDPNALFLTFNYTRTLEECYSISSKRILHIHGVIEPEHKANIILGHRELIDFNRFHDPESLDPRILGGNDILNESIRDTYKNSEKIIKENKLFFERLSSVKEIYVFGHSLSGVDEAYYKEVLNNITQDVKWLVTFYNKDYFEKQARINSLGIFEENVDYCNMSELRQ